MIDISAVGAGPSRYELRFTGLFDRGRGYVFPCDAQGKVNIEELTERARTNHVLARSLVGIELSAPILSRVP